MGSAMASAMATETNERKMCPWMAGTMSSQKFSEIHSQSMSLGSSMRSCNKRARLPTRDVSGSGELFYGVYGQQPLFAALLHDTSGGTGPDDLRERVPHGQLLAYAGKVVGATVRRLELYVADAHEREPLEDAVVADERGDELGVRVREDVLRGVVLGEEAALLEDGDLVAYLYGLVYVVGDEDDGLLDVLLNTQELVLEPLARDRVHRSEGLVHEHDRGVCGHRARHPDPLLLAARELRRVTVAVLVRVEAHELQELVHAPSYALLVPVQEARHGGDVLGDGAVGEEPYLLDGVADLAPQAGAAHGGVRLAVYEDLPRGGFDEAVYHPHRRGLAASRGSHQNADLPFGNFEGEVVDYGPFGAGIGLAHVPKLDHCISCAPRGNTVAGRCHRPAGSRLLQAVRGTSGEVYVIRDRIVQVNRRRVQRIETSRDYRPPAAGRG